MRISDATLSPRFYSFVQHLLADPHANRSMITEGLAYHPGMRVLDLGCGTGLYAEQVNAADYVGVDILPAYIEKARQAYPERRFELMEARNLRDLELKFDRVMSIGLLHHISDDEVRELLKSVTSVLEPNGFLYIFEAAWPDSRFDVIATAIRYFDRGEYVRTRSQWSRLFADYKIENQEIFYSRFCPTYIARIRAK